MSTKITNVSDNCINLIIKFECGDNIDKYLIAYKCPAGVWTIGVGTTIYPNGQKVKQGDTITKEQAMDYLKYDLRNIESSIDAYTTDLINQNQFDSLASFAYNLGTNAPKNSTLLKKVNINPNDSTIRAEFDKWVYANGKVLQGLVNRRKAEADLYFF